VSFLEKAIANVKDSEIGYLNKDYPYEGLRALTHWVVFVLKLLERRLAGFRGYFQVIVESWRYFRCL